MMNNWLFLIIPILLVGLAFALTYRRSSRPSSSSISDNANFHAVSFIPGEHACHAVMKLQHKRFLASEADQIPVSGCDAVECSCKYQHYTDRRSGRERRYPSVTMDGIETLGEHRSGLERRHSIRLQIN